jgi:ferredoxin
MDGLALALITRKKLPLADYIIYIHPHECVECEACLPECPVEAIFYEGNVPTPWLDYIELNAKRSKECPPAQPK